MNKLTFLKYLRFANLLVLGIVAGELFGEWIAMSPVLDTLPANTFTQLKQLLLPAITLPMIILIAFSLISAIAIVVLSQGYYHQAFFKKVFLLNLTAFLIILIFTLSTLLINVPINQAELRWSINLPPDNWMQLRDRWDLAHTFRTALAAVAFVFQLIATFLLTEENAKN